MSTVRKATEQDRFGLFQLAAHMHAETDFACLDFNPSKALENLGNWIHHPDGLMLVAVDGEDVCGMLAATAKQPWFSTEEIGSEDLFYVRQDKRGGRAAYRMLEAYLQWCRDRGIRYARAGVSTGEEVGAAAERLYLHFGAHRTGACFAFNL